MGVFTFSAGEFTSPVAPARLFQALVLDNHFLPKVLPEFMKNIEFVKGDSTVVGCITQINFSEGAPFKYLKKRIDEIDTTKFYVKYTCIEGDVLGDNLECVVVEQEYKPSGTGTNFKAVTHLHTKGDYVAKDEEVAKEREIVKKIMKAAEDYLIANPQVYA